MSTALALFKSLCEIGNCLEQLRDTYCPESDQWLWHTEVLGQLDSVVDLLVESQGLGGADDNA